MSVPDRDTALAAMGVHVDTADADMSSLRISQATADQVREVRESINEATGTKVVTNEDVVRLALLTLGRLDVVADQGPEALTEGEADVMSPLMNHVRNAADPDVLHRHMDNPAEDGGDSE
jgi:hypothetical protein